MNKNNLKKMLASTVSITSVQDVQDTLTSIVARAFSLFWVVAVGMIIWAAYLFLSAGGDETRIEKAKKILLYAVIAAAVALLSIVLIHL